MKRLLFHLRWWRWFLSSPARAGFGYGALGPNSSSDWKIAMDRWQEREPKY